MGPIHVRYSLEPTFLILESHVSLQGSRRTLHEVLPSAHCSTSGISAEQRKALALHSSSEALFNFCLSELESDNIGPHALHGRLQFSQLGKPRQEPCRPHLGRAGLTSISKLIHVVLVSSAVKQT